MILILILIFFAEPHQVRYRRRKTLIPSDHHIYSPQPPFLFQDTNPAQKTHERKTRNQQYRTFFGWRGRFSTWNKYVHVSTWRRLSTTFQNGGFLLFVSWPIIHHCDMTREGYGLGVADVAEEGGQRRNRGACRALRARLGIVVLAHTWRAQHELAASKSLFILTHRLKYVGFNPSTGHLSRSCVMEGRRGGRLSKRGENP